MLLLSGRRFWATGREGRRRARHFGAIFVLWALRQNFLRLRRARRCTITMHGFHGFGCRARRARRSRPLEGAAAAWAAAAASSSARAAPAAGLPRQPDNQQSELNTTPCGPRRPPRLVRCSLSLVRRLPLLFKRCNKAFAVHMQIWYVCRCVRAGLCGRETERRAGGVSRDPCVMRDGALGGRGRAPREAVYFEGFERFKGSGHKNFACGAGLKW